MRRLTSEEGICVDCNGIAFCKTDCKTKKIYDRLKYYEDAEENLSNATMTLEELRKEAARHGYVLTKKQPYEAFPTCSCRKGQGLYRFIDRYGYYYRCPVCMKRSKSAKLVIDAKANWNNGIFTD